jgi:hypothetical protein
MGDRNVVCPLYKLSWVTLQLTVSQSVVQSVLALSPCVTLDKILAEVNTVTGLMLWYIFPDGRTGLSSLCDTLLESSSLDPPWNLLYFTLYWSFVSLTLSGVSWSELLATDRVTVILLLSVCLSVSPTLLWAPSWDLWHIFALWQKILVLYVMGHPPWWVDESVT